MLIFVKTNDGNIVPVRMSDDFLSESSVDSFDKHMNSIRSMFPGNINYFYLAGDRNRKFYI